ncbi:FecR family protein [Prosthecobacter fusiformis]|uniref:FecR family protein n=1 Tax=Prosthecobacter fusiformis TaxID=48464 RepID=A0A4R7S158_9BACT|nr:FecR domain-containing protein [Prosthecobacter fusiformis]TDU71128.1 FecR family protein [Prosthecobacter fusiformis]
MIPTPPEDPFKLNRRLDRLIEGSLTAEEAQEVQAWMKSDPEILSLYLEKMRMESLLRDHAWPARPKAARWRTNARQALVWAAAAVILLSAIGLFWRYDSPPGSALADGSGLPSVQFSAASVFDTTLARLPDDGRLQFGDGVIMNDGSVSIRLPSGVEAVLKSPSRFAITGANRLKLDHGAGWFRVPPAAKGFTVDLPEMEVVDLGTVFTVSVDEEEHQVQVEQGLVEVRQRLGEIPVRQLKAGEKLMRRANQQTVQVVSGTSLMDPLAMMEKPEIVFQESLAAVPDQPFTERQPLKGTWTVLEGDPQISKGRFAAKSSFTHLMGRFTRPIESSENAVIMVSFKSASPMSLFHSKGFAGVSLFDGDGEMFFLGDKYTDSYSWELVAYGRNFWRPGEGQKKPAYNLAIQGSEETFTLRYRQRTGTFEVFRGWGVQGLPVVRGMTDPGLRFDGVRVANGQGGDFSFEELQVSVIKDTAE